MWRVQSSKPEEEKMKGDKGELRQKHKNTIMKEKSDRLIVTVNVRGLNVPVRTQRSDGKQKITFT